MQLAFKAERLSAYTGSSLPPIFRLDYGARNQAVGGAGVALYNNMFYIDSNPAGGNFYKIYRIAVLHQEWIYDTNYETARLFIGFKRFYIGGGFNYIYTPFVYYNYFGEKIGGSYTVSQYLGIVNFGYKIRKLNISIGANVKYYYYSVPTGLYKSQNYSAVFGDIGFMLPTNLFKTYIGYMPSMTFGLVIKNIGYYMYSDKIPLEAIAGISFRYKKNFLFSMQMNLPLYEPFSLSLGAEYSLYKSYFFDCGVKIQEIPSFSFGVGYRRDDFRVRITYSPSIRFFNMVSAEISYSFGETKHEENMEKVERLFINALKFFSEKDYDGALRDVAEILNLDPGNYWAEKLMKVIIQQIEINRKLEEIEKLKNDQG